MSMGDFWKIPKDGGLIAIGASQVNLGLKISVPPTHPYLNRKGEDLGLN